MNEGYKNKKHKQEIIISRFMPNTIANLRHLSTVIYKNYCQFLKLPYSHKDYRNREISTKRSIGNPKNLNIE
ncbi:hypothetical protein TTHERM_00627280 (macronuclear) [Tetrahymena thermophila SB210]|uniref:Uncharacterized protein n=1 Tax=Tetrahymena thermophila (strain SB210) TaxID=312017 RepID=Q23RX1_TETTS|nr:hypothetical protein TTHERM_00627280 [Tetrahymena thermophila SB210]EAR99268.2 hypothetical protein TTHERM_00627280 [Tetrahymena thermophila SB210]|eukprot:XP_001019513.2 hypothetical protein TTHERM_00627280 [Tetrahymena thermophila SB210]